MRYLTGRCWLGWVLVAATGDGISAVLLGDEPRLVQVRLVPVLPGRDDSLEGRGPRADAVLVDRRHGGPVGREHGPDQAS